MKIHKITLDRIYFSMDSGAYGSIAKKDVDKLQIASLVDIEMVIDGRRDGCIVDDLIKKQKETSGGSSNLE